MVVRRPLTLALAALPLAFIGLFFVFPVASILVRGLAPNGALDLAVPLQVLTGAETRDVLWFTFWQATLSTLLTLAVGLPGALLLARFDFPGRRLLNALVLVPFVLPTVVVGSAFLALVGPSGAFGLGLDHTIWAILAAHVFYNCAVVLRVVGGVWAQLDPRTEEAARVLGASRWRAFRDVTWPLLRPAVLSASSIVFLFTFTSFGVILILGGFGFATIEVAVYRAAAVLLDLPAAATLALLQLGFLGTVLVVYSRLQANTAVAQRLTTARVAARRPRGRYEWAFVCGTIGLLLIVLGLPLAALVERAFASSTGYGLDNFNALFGESAGGALFVRPIDAVTNSLVFAAAATAICLPLGLLAGTVIAYRRGTLAAAFDALLMLPLGTSAVIVGFGFLVSLGQLPIDLRTSPILIPIAHALVALPFVVRATVPLLRSIDGRLREAAAVLGASPAQTWRMVDLPLVGRALLVGGSFAFAVSLGEFGATLFIVRPDAPTMPIAIFRLLSQPGALAFGQAMAMATVLMVVTAIAALAFDRLRTNSVGGT
ncbi:MAG TPA: iron ABC transporter permease [Candidatus Limnocylindria bacterium]|nr:iron ABC transporter permease [Candidatus Limnocylindria bacterium]